ncbi:MAG: DUF1800 family protein [Planctomycetota bacterium]
MAIQAGGVTLRRHSTARPLPGAGSGPNVDPTEDLTPWQPSATDPWDAAKIQHLFRRAGFGVGLAETQTAIKVGHKVVTDVLLFSPKLTIPTHGVFLLPSGEIVNLTLYQGQISAWLYLMHNSPWPLQEKMALFFHDHFATGIDKVRYPEMMGTQINLFRKHGLGNFRDMLIEISKNPAMLVWLDNTTSRVGKPNENYAREIFELFSMGVKAPYTETDIQEAARALTGHRTRLDSYFWQNVWHDYLSKTVLGKTIFNRSPNGAKDLEDLVDIILGHPATAKFICAKIWEYFVYEKPSAVLVDKLASLWRSDNYDLQALMETIFRSVAFYSTKAMGKAVGGLVKNPWEFTIGALRNLGVSKISYFRVGVRSNGMGHTLLDYSNPAGLPDGTNWINSQNLINRANYAKEVIQRVPRGFLYDKGYTGFTGRWMPLPDLKAMTDKAGVRTPAAIVDFFLGILVSRPVPKGVRDNLIGFMTKYDNNVTRVWNYAAHAPIKNYGLAHLIMALPEYQVN